VYRRHRFGADCGVDVTRVSCVVSHCRLGRVVNKHVSDFLSHPVSCDVRRLVPVRQRVGFWRMADGMRIRDGGAHDRRGTHEPTAAAGQRAAPAPRVPPAHLRDTKGGRSRLSPETRTCRTAFVTAQLTPCYLFSAEVSKDASQRRGPRAGSMRGLHARADGPDLLGEARREPRCLEDDARIAWHWRRADGGERLAGESELS
jgi:hypothetical protein